MIHIILTKNAKLSRCSKVQNVFWVNQWNGMKQKRDEARNTRPFKGGAIPFISLHTLTFLLSSLLSFSFSTSRWVRPLGMHWLHGAQWWSGLPQEAHFSDDWSSNSLLFAQAYIAKTAISQLHCRQSAHKMATWMKKQKLPQPGLTDWRSPNMYQTWSFKRPISSILLSWCAQTTFWRSDFREEKQKKACFWCSSQVA